LDSWRLLLFVARWQDLWVQFRFVWWKTADYAVF